MSGRIHPRGTVEVECKVCPTLLCATCWPDGPPEGSRTFFWVDALDPRLPNGPFICDACKAGQVSHLVCGDMTEPLVIRVRCACPSGCAHGEVLA